MATSMRSYRVGISGSYGGLNLGDEAILRSMVAQLRASLPVEVTVFSRNVTDTLARHHVERAVPVRDISRDEAREEIRRLDLFILGGGGILYDSDAEAYLREVLLAHELGVPVMTYAISAGPLTKPAPRAAISTALNRAAVLTVRDRHARQLLEECGVQQPIHVTADPAILLEPEPLPDECLEHERLDRHVRLVGFSVREPGPAAPDIDVAHYHSLVANAADYVIDRLDADVVFVPMERGEMDMQHSHAVVAMMHHASRAQVLKDEYTSGQVLAFMSRLDLAVGMRLHFLILAAVAGVPIVALPYASKVTGFVEAMEMDMPPLKKVSAGQLIAHIDRAWDMREEIRARITRLLPALKAKARQTNELAVELLTRAERQKKTG